MTSGQTLFYNRAAWAKLHLKKAGLIEYPQRSVTRITEAGIKFVATKPKELRLRTLAQFPDYANWRGQSQASGADPQVTPTSIEDEEKAIPPNEQLANAFSQLQDALAAELLERIHQYSPTFFEKLVLDVLVAMGYGGSFMDAQQHVGRGGDGGIDGIIREDRLGLERIYIQAKRWERTVGRPDIQQFAGALQGRRARKGVFITSSDFSREAKDYADGLEIRVSLIDGRMLAGLMIEHNVGVSVDKPYILKRIDNDYFEEE
jgi:restriction system protein